MLEPEQVSRWRRECNAMIKASTDDPEAFAAVKSILDDTAASLPLALDSLRAQGFSYADIARALGVSRQNVHKFRSRVRR